MAGFSLVAAASIAVGLSLGAAATVGVTLAMDDHRTVPARIAPAARNPAGPYLVDYGSRCWHGHCVPWP
ncbi:hypothetical protein AWC11_04475 [Mycobacterium interjectum]|jgi:hypothetical protein|nr:hypothetical protein AWC11_04475 [Mycobacterium interjectum]